jgi:hypothetical protein
MHAWKTSSLASREPVVGRKFCHIAKSVMNESRELSSSLYNCRKRSGSSIEGSV